jgi:hypothetical protein
MGVDGGATEKRCVLSLRVFARECGGRAVGGSALSEKIAEALLPGCSGVNLTVPCGNTEREEQSE